MAKKIYLFKEDHIPDKAAFPVIDAHNHLWGNWQVDKVIRTMDSTGVISFCDVTGNVRIEFGGGGYKTSGGNINDFFKNCSERYPEDSTVSPCHRLHVPQMSRSLMTTGSLQRNVLKPS